MPHIDLNPPDIDYLAKDYASFRRLMLDHLSQLVPDWKDRDPADLGYALVEVLAYAADYLSYYQDAVATEAYLSTARLRRSVRRHVRLLEYYLEEGCNARAWVQIQVNNKLVLPVHTQLLTQLPGFEKSVIDSDEAAYAQAMADGTPVFETMHHIHLIPDHNQIPVRPRNDKETVLPRGSTSAHLYYDWKQKTSDPKHVLPKPGSVLVFMEQSESANPDHCYVVRLTRVTLKEGADGSAARVPPHRRANDSWLEVEWAGADALPDDLSIGPFDFEHPNSSPAVALGNIVLVDHGRTIYDEELQPVQPGQRYRPHLRFPDLTFAVPFDWRDAQKQPAIQAMTYQPYQAYGCMSLSQYSAFIATREKYSREPMLLVDVPKDKLQIPRGQTGDEPILAAMQYSWQLRRDLLNSGPFDRDFQVEMEGDRRAYLRFGFGGVGKLPDPGETFVATYRIGNGSRGNVGAGSIAHVVNQVGETRGDLEATIMGVGNPLPAWGGADPEEIESARLHAPYAFHEQKACVTPQDYAQRALQYPAVVHAAARTRWTGSRDAVVIAVQRTGGMLVDEMRSTGSRRVVLNAAQRADGMLADEAFQHELLNFIEPYRLMSHEVLIEDPCYVPVQISLAVTLQPRAVAAVVLEALAKTFGTQIWPDGEVGFFYPDNFDFGQSLHQSQVIARAMAIPGVHDVQVKQFERAHEGQNVLEIPIQPEEIARLECIDILIEDRP